MSVQVGIVVSPGHNRCKIHGVSMSWKIENELVELTPHGANSTVSLKHWVIVQIAIPLYKKEPLRIRGSVSQKDVHHSKRKRPFGQNHRPPLFFHEQRSVAKKVNPLPRRRAVEKIAKPSKQNPTP